MGDGRLRIVILALPSLHPFWSESSAARFFKTHHFRLMVHKVYAPSMWVLGGKNLGHVDPVIENLTGAATGSFEERARRAEPFFRLVAENALHATATLVCTTKLLCPVTLAEMRENGVEAVSQLSAKRREAFGKLCQRVSRFFSFALLYASNPASEFRERARVSAAIRGTTLDRATADLIDAYVALLEKERSELIAEDCFETVEGVELRPGGSAGFWCDVLNRTANVKEKINPRRLEPPASLRDFYGIDALIDEDSLRGLQDFSATESLLSATSPWEIPDEGRALARRGCTEDFLKGLLAVSSRFRTFLAEAPQEDRPGFMRDKVFLAKAVAVGPV